VRIVAIDVDDPGQHAAMVEKLDLPFPMLSDTDRTGAIDRYDVADPSDPRGLARPAVILLDDRGVERFRFVSRDFADRLPESDVLDAAQGLGLAAVTQDRPVPGVPVPGDRAMPLEQLLPYLRGARFAALAMGLRHRHVDPAIAEDSKAFVALMDDYVEVLRDRWRRARES
jgi:hypothetical protein